MSRTASVNLFTDNFAQLGYRVVLYYFSCLSSCWHTVLKNICPFPGVLISPFCQQSTSKGCIINVSFCALCYPIAQVWHCRLSPDVLWNCRGSLQHQWAVFTNSELWVWIVIYVHCLRKEGVPTRSLSAQRKLSNSLKIRAPLRRYCIMHGLQQQSA